MGLCFKHNVTEGKSLGQGNFQSLCIHDLPTSSLEPDILMVLRTEFCSAQRPKVCKGDGVTFSEFPLQLLYYVLIHHVISFKWTINNLLLNWLIKTTVKKNKLDQELRGQ